MSLEGRGAVITGGGRGIGKAVARYLAEAGASVVVSARSTDQIEAVADELRSDGYSAHAVTCDVSDEESVQVMADEAASLLGTVDILVNNAGIAPSNPVKRLTLEEWNRVQSINVTGTFLCTRAFLQGMLDRQWGRIVNVASVAGLRGSKYIAAYCASKHAQIGFTRALADEVADQGITVNAICPGYVDTPMTEYSVVQITREGRREPRRGASAHPCHQPPEAPDSAGGDRGRGGHAVREGRRGHQRAGHRDRPGTGEPLAEGTTMGLLRDVKYALRSLVRSPIFTTAAVLTLALGIGANTAVFSVVSGVLLRPLPHADGDRLVYLRQSAQLAGVDNALFSVPEIIDFRDAGGITDLAEFSANGYNLTARGEPQQVLAGIVSGNFFDVMGLRPEVGRLIDTGDDGEAASPVIVLTYDYWMRAFGGDPGVVGETVDLGGRAATIVGVVQQAPHYPQRTDIIVNMVTSPHHLSATMVHGRTHRMTEVFGRLAGGATVEQVQSEVDRIQTRIHDEYPEAYEQAAGYDVSVKPLVDVLTERATGTIYLLWSTAAFVLLIACASVASLVLTRSVRRERELTVRAALGAGRARIRRMLLVESGLIALTGALLGVLVAVVGVDLLSTFASRFTPRASEVSLDGTVLAFTAAVAAAVALTLGWAPTIPGGSPHDSGSLASSGTRTTGGRGFRRTQRALVVTQVALSVTLLTGAGLLVRTLLNLYDVDVGADLEHVLTVEVPVSGAGLTTADVRDRYERMRSEIAALPGVAETGVGSSVPLRDNDFQLEIVAEGVAPDPDRPTPLAEYRTATPEFFRATGIPLLAGREFESTDDTESAPVVILNEALAQRLFPDRDPIGQSVAWTGEVLQFIPVTPDWRTVVGVVGDTRSGSLDQTPRAAMYQPFAQEMVFGGSLVIRADADPSSLLVPATRIVREVDPDVPIGKVGTPRGSPRRERLVPADQRAARLGLRPRRAADRGGGPGGGARLLGDPAHQRDRRAHEPRRSSGSGAGDDPLGGWHPARDRAAAGSRGIALRLPRPGRPPLRRRAERSDHVRGGGARDRRRGARGDAHSGGESVEHPPGGSPQDGVGAPAPTAFLTAGATTVPSSSIARMTLSWGMGPTVSWMRTCGRAEQLVLVEDLLDDLRPGSPATALRAARLGVELARGSWEAILAHARCGS